MLIKALKLQLDVFVCVLFSIQFEDTVKKLKDITSGVHEALSDSCTCDISSDIIDQESFDCSDPSSLDVTYRARLSGTPETDSHVFISHIEIWVSGGPNVRVQGILMRIDGDCQVSIESFNDALCTDAPMTTAESDTPTTPDNDTSTTVETDTSTITDSDSPTTASRSSQSSSENTAGIIGGVVAVVLIIAVVIVIIVFILAIIMWKSRHGELSMKTTEE